MKKLLSAVTSGAAIALALGFSAGAFAQSTWNYNVPCDPTPACAVGGVSATISGFGSSGANYVAGSVTDQDPSGLGFTSSGETTSSPHHAFDNVGGSGLGTSNETLLIGFNAKVQLTAMAIGWSSGDADVSVLRWDGAGAPTMTGIAGPGGLAGAGWTLVSSKDVDSSANNFVLNTGVGTNKNDAKVSSWWLISTYFGATDSTNGLDTANDYFKILSFTGSVCTGTVTGGNGGNGGTCGGGGGDVPEPGTVALAAIGALAAFGARRRAKKPAA